MVNLMSTEIEQEIKEIRKKLDELIIISRNILDLLVKEDEPLPDEIAAIERTEELIDEKTYLRSSKSDVEIQIFILFYWFEKRCILFV